MVVHRFFRNVLLSATLVCTGFPILHAASGPSKPSGKQPGLLFYLSGDYEFTADDAEGNPGPNFLEDVKIIPDGARGPGFQCENDQLMSYWAPGNIFAERGTLSFFWRSRDPVGETEFPIFRVGFADHSSWDMVWLRIDYNGHGFDAFVTDANLARIRVSVPVSPFPGPDVWIHLALTWDETVGIRFYINGKLAAKKDSVAVLYSGLDQFGPHSRIIAPSQVQSAYNFQRGGDIDEIKIYDRMLSDRNIAALAKGGNAGSVPQLSRSLDNPRWKSEWNLRYGWNRTGDAPEYLAEPSMRIRKVEIQDVYDLKRWWWKATDGIRETTWPGVYNRSRLPGRNDYFQLPDWDCYSLSGKSVTFFMPDEKWNHLEISGSAYGPMTLLPSDSGGSPKTLFERPKGQEKTFHQLNEPLTGGKIQFTNVEQEMPIGELSAYDVEAGKEPAGIATLDYTLAGSAGEVKEQLEPAVNFINRRYEPDERATMVAVPAAAKQVPGKESRSASLPLVHILVPFNSMPLAHGAHLDSSYAWRNIHGGLDGIAIDLPPLKLKPSSDGLIALNIQIKDPIWPMRNMFDFSFSVKPGEARTLWLDTRDRILTGKECLYLAIASASSGFGPRALKGAHLRLVFKPWNDASCEHVQDRFNQVRDNYAFLCEEHPSDPRLNLYNRLMADVGDLLRVDPKHYPGQNYVYDFDRTQTKPPFVQPACPQDVPLWAFRQVEDLRYFKRFVLWWIDHRRISNGELGGGLSDDDDQTNCWPGAVLMGCEPKNIGSAVLRMLDAMYDQNMFTNGLATIQTDGLHAHEEGIEAQEQALLVDYGSPKQLERIMETVRALDTRLMLKNKAGHRHFRSSYFSGTKIAEDGVWEWTLQQQEFLLLEPVLALAEYNGNPRARQLAIDMADGLLAHARKDTNGKILLDTQINFSSDSARPSPLGTKSMLAASMGPGATLSTSSSGLQLLWAVFRMTGDKKYLQPLLDLGPDVLGVIAGDGLDLMQVRDTWGKQIVSKTTPARGTDLFRHIAWQMTGDKSYLEQYYADQIEDSALREYINTEGSLWTDRVFAANRELQRSRLGGIGLVRGMNNTGHAISWKFDAPSTEESVAILVPKATPDELKILVYNLDKNPVGAEMTAWDVQAGKWEILRGFALNGGEKADTILSKDSIDLERSKDIHLTFAPRTTTVLALKLLSPTTPCRERPDLGIGREDVAVQGNVMKVNVHSLGAVEAPISTLALMENGKLIASTSIPVIPPPLDLTPKVSEVSLSIPAGVNWTKCSLCIDPEKKLHEITLLNNQVELSEVVPMVEHTNQAKPEDQITELAKQPRIEHIAFNVKDPEAVAAWYCRHLGMKIVRKNPQPPFTHMVADGGDHLMMELYANPKAPVPDYAALSHMAFHLAFMTDNMQAARDSLVAAGAKVVDDITTTPAGDQVLMLRDPWGMAIQCVKRAAPMLGYEQFRPEHFALNVPEPEAMRNWYLLNLGMKSMRKSGEPTFTNFASDDAENMMLELYHNGDYPAANMAGMSPLSFHIAFVVTDVRAIRTGLIEAGATLAEDIRVSSSGDEVLVLRDPWGVPIQFIKHANRNAK